MFYYTYVLRSKKDQGFYTGSTNDLRKRLVQHNKGLILSTKNRRPLAVVYYEACLNEQDARARQKQLKSGRGKYYLRERLKRFLNRTG